LRFYGKLRYNQRQTAPVGRNFGFAASAGVEQVFFSRPFGGQPNINPSKKPVSDGMAPVAA